MNDPVRCVHCGKVLCDRISGDVMITDSTEYFEEYIQFIIYCSRCKKKYSLIA